MCDCFQIESYFPKEATDLSISETHAASTRAAAFRQTLAPSRAGTGSSVALGWCMCRWCRAALLPVTHSQAGPWDSFGIQRCSLQGPRQRGNPCVLFPFTQFPILHQHILWLSLNLSLSHTHTDTHTHMSPASPAPKQLGSTGTRSHCGMWSGTDVDSLRCRLPGP